MSDVRASRVRPSVRAAVRWTHSRPATLRVAVLPLLLVLMAAGWTHLPDPLGPLRHLYLQAVQEKSAIAEATAEIERLRGTLQPAEGDRLAGVLTAYEGALETLHAKHGFWPPDRLRHLRRGLSTMDTAVAGHPTVAEIRYLRLMSCYYLPGILGRNSTVREDFAALAQLLPGVVEEYPPQLYRAIGTFVLNHGDVSLERRRALEAALQRTGE